MSNLNLIKNAKRQLRVAVKKKLNQLSPNSIETQSTNISKTVIKLPQFNNAKKIALYMNMPHMEVQTLNLIKLCYELNKEVYLPKCVNDKTTGRKNNHLIMLKVPNFEAVTQLKPQGKFQLLEPLEGEDIMDNGKLDMIIIPGVAFTKTKKRLGHGAGFYDEFLNVYNEKFGEKPNLLGIGLKEQLVDDIPKEDHDWDLDTLVIDGYPPF